MVRRPRANAHAYPRSLPVLIGVWCLGADARHRRNMGRWGIQGARVLACALASLLLAWSSFSRSAAAGFIDDGEVAFLASQHSGQAAGGGVCE